MPRVVSLPQHLPFLDTLARGLWDIAGGDTFRLAEMQVYLPTRRACRELRTAFLRLTDGKPLLLPRLLPLGDVDEDELAMTHGDLDLPPAISPLRRQLLLMRLIQQKDDSLSFEQAAALAEALAHLIDQVQIEGCDFKDLEKLAGDSHSLSEHWQEVLRFLSIVTEAWPAILAAEGNLLDPADRRNRLLAAQKDAWAAHPPATPLIIAGSTATVPAVGSLMQQAAELPAGLVILPGLDLNSDEETWQAVTEIHPQYTMKTWLEKCGIKRSDVGLWPGPAQDETGRTLLLQEAMRPPATTDKWREIGPRLGKNAFQGIERIATDTVQDEANSVALRLRALLEETEKTALFVTPNRALALRVVSALKRWGIEANDSAGAPLSASTVGSFLNAVWRAGDTAATALDFLSLMKHPLAAFGKEAAAIRTLARVMEVQLWRGPRRNDGWEAVKELAKKEPESAPEATRIALLFDPVTKGWNTPLPFVERLDQHLALAEAVASNALSDGSEILWQGVAGEEAALWINELKQAARDFPPLNGKDYAALFAALMEQVTVRAAYAAHGRLNILGPLEARLQSADLVIIGDMNEGSWPAEPAPDPWMSRPMQKQFGLPLPERRLGLSAHDFVQMASSRQILITRAKRSGSAPTVPSRFLLQIEAVLEACGHKTAEVDPLVSRLPWGHWARALDQPEALVPVVRPAPCPALKDRPDRLPVTEISTWLRNPYGIYAKRILKLKRLEAIDEALDAADRGTAIHEALELFCRRVREPWDDTALAQLLQIGEEVFEPFEHEPTVLAFWRPRFKRIAAWFIDTMRARQKTGYRIANVECKGALAFADGAFTLYGYADRIDRTPDGGLAIVDYKTTVPPSEKSIKAGYEPQLPLLALIASAGCIENVPAGPTVELAYWRLQGMDEAGAEKTLKDTDLCIARARERLEVLIAHYALPNTAYLAQPQPHLKPKYDDYAALARIAEWTEEDS